MQAKEWNFVLSVLAITAALGFGMGGASMHLPTAIVLTLMPAVLIYLVNREPLSYAIGIPKRDPRIDLGIAFMACGFGLILGNHEVHFVDTQLLVECAVLVGLLCCAGIFAAARKNPQFWGAMFGMLFIAGSYGWGLTAAADSVIDKSAPAKYTTMVENKHESHGRGTTYYLDLAPWGPIQAPYDLRVSNETYDGTMIGGQVCLELYPGVLHVQWYRIVPCDSEQR